MANGTRSGKGRGKGHDRESEDKNKERTTNPAATESKIAPESPPHAQATGTVEITTEDCRKTEANHLRPSVMEKLKQIVRLEQQTYDFLKIQTELLHQRVLTRKPRTSTIQEIHSLNELQIRLLLLAARPTLSYTMSTLELVELAFPGYGWVHEKQCLRIRLQIPENEDQKLERPIVGVDADINELERRRQRLIEELPESPRVLVQRNEHCSLM